MVSYMRRESETSPPKERLKISETISIMKDRKENHVVVRWWDEREGGKERGRERERANKSKWHRYLQLL